MNGDQMTAEPNIDPGFATDVPLPYLLETKPLPETPFADHPSLAALMTARIEAKAREKRLEADRLASAESKFRRYTVRLLADLVEAGEVHKSALRFVGAPGRFASGSYGIIIVKQRGSTLNKARIVMANAETPYLVQFDHEASNGHTYDLASMTPHGSSAGFARPYSGLLEDLATWAVAGDPV